jgi:NAD(P)-dependent dehydrogenase (short-subunit alcohol dehydrogenase family)
LLVVAELRISRARRKRPASRGSVALFTDSFEGMGAAAAKRLVRDGYAVRIYCAVKRDLAAGGSRDASNAAVVRRQ